MQGEINNEDVVEMIKNLNPNLIAVHGSSIIKEPLINAFLKRVINLHAGLSPYYRGSGTNIYPFYDKKLEYVGMTVHYLDAGIDSGDIILQGRPVFEANDNVHTIGCKNVILGSKLMIDVLEEHIRNGPPNAVKQDSSRGNLFLKRDFNEDVVRIIWKNIDAGIVRDYAKHPNPVKMVDKIIK